VQQSPSDCLIDNCPLLCYNVTSRTLTTPNVAGAPSFRPARLPGARPPEHRFCSVENKCPNVTAPQRPDAPRLFYQPDHPALALQNIDLVPQKKVSQCSLAPQARRLPSLLPASPLTPRPSERQCLNPQKKSTLIQTLSHRAGAPLQAPNRPPCGIDAPRTAPFRPCSPTGKLHTHWHTIHQYHHRDPSGPRPEAPSNGPGPPQTEMHQLGSSI
jgi:hypothetical protein